MPMTPEGTPEGLTSSNVPDPATWEFDKTTGDAHVPAREVVKVYETIAYLTKSLAACHAVAPN